MFSAEVMLYYSSNPDNDNKQGYGILGKWTAEPNRPFPVLMSCLSDTIMNEK